MADYTQDMNMNTNVGFPQTNNGAQDIGQSSNLQQWVFGGIPYGQQSASVLATPPVDDFSLSADDIPDFGEDSQVVGSPAVQPDLSHVASTNTSPDFSIPSPDSSVSVLDNSTDSGGIPPLDASANKSDISPTEELTNPTSSVDRVAVSWTSSVVSEFPDSPAESVNVSDDSFGGDDVVRSQTPTVYEEARSVEERDLDRSVGDARSSLVDKFYELSTLIAQCLEISPDQTFSLLAHDTDQEHVEYRFVRVKNVDAGFKIEKVITHKPTGNVETIVLTMTYKVSFSSLRLYINWTMLYQEVKGEDQWDDNRPIILDKINKFLLLVGDYYAGLQQQREEREQKKQLSLSLRSF